MTHLLQPDTDSDTERTEQTKSIPTLSTNDATATAEVKKSKIQIEEDDEEEEEVPINKKIKTATTENPPPEQNKPQASANSNTFSEKPATATTTTSAAAEVSLSGPNKDHYHFQCLSDRKPFPFLGGDKDLTALIDKWGLGESMSCLQFSYEMLIDAHSFATSKSAKSIPGQVHSAMLPDFTAALLNSDEFLRHFRCGDGHGNATTSGETHHRNATPLHLPSPVTSVRIKNVRAQETTLDMFDRLIAPPVGGSSVGGEHKKSRTALMHPRMRDLPHQIVRDNGRVCNMPDVFLPCGITVSDQLRGLFMLRGDDETECYDAFSEEERNEFLWHVMWRLVSGGAVNQYEDEFQPYKDAVRDVYKSLVSVGRRKNFSATTSTTNDHNNKAVDKEVENDDDDDDCENAGGRKVQVMEEKTESIFEVQSIVGMVEDVKCGKASIKKMLFPKDDRTGNHNFLYVIVDPLRRTCIVWYNAFFSPF